MPDSTAEFNDLLAHIRRGDEAALAQLLGRYESIVRRAARALIGPALRPFLDSVDVVQSVHRSLLIGMRFHKFEITSPDSLLGLTLTMVRRKVARHWRRLKHQPPGVGTTSAGAMASVAAALRSPEVDPASAVRFEHDMKLLLSELDATDRRLLELRLEGHSTADVARRMGVDSRFLRVRLGRLRKRLRERGVLTDWF